MLAAATAREISAEGFVKFNNELYRRIFELVMSPDSSDRLGGIIAIDRLIDFESSEENTTKVTRFANYLRNVLPGSDPQIAILASKALGRLANPAAALPAEMVESEVKRSLEWLQGERSESRRFAAVLVIKELTSNASTIVYSFIPQILDSLWAGLRDPKISIREGAAEALSECLGLVQARDNQLRRQLYRKVFEEAYKGFKMSTADAIHGSLLAIRELLMHTTKLADGSRYSEVCDVVMKLKEHREFTIRKAVITVIANLAQFDPEQFIEHHLASSMAYLTAQLRKEKERSAAFITVGKIAIAVSQNILPYLDEVLVCVKESLALRGSKLSRATLDSTPFQCIGMLALAVGSALTKYTNELLDCMFSNGLSEPLCTTLADLSKFIPDLVPTIQDRLLATLTTVLSSRTATSYTPSSKIGVPTVPILMRDTQPTDTRDNEIVILALKTLGTFVLPSPIVDELLKRLLSVSITDPDASIRHAILLALDNSSIDIHLIKPENLRTLMIALNDEVFVIRETVIAIVGRLSLLDQTLIMPSLRKLVIKLLAELEYAGISRQKEESARLLSQLMISAPHLVEPYVEPILGALLPKARDASPGVSSKILAAIGELAYFGSTEFVPHLDKLMSIILEALQDQTSASKREVALRALSQIASKTGWVAEPVIKYPNLLTLLVTLLKTEKNLLIRRETIRVLGVLGAVDPYRHKMAPTKSDSETNGPVDAFIPVQMISVSSEEYYPAVALNALLRVLRDSSLSIHHSAVVTAIVYIFKILGPKCTQFLPQVVPPMLAVMKVCPSGILEFYFQQLGVMISIAKIGMHGYFLDVIALIHDHWTSSTNVQNAVLLLIETSAAAFEGDFKIYLPALLPRLLPILETDTTEKRQTAMRLLRTLSFFGHNLEENLPLIVPAIVKVFERTDNPIWFRKQAIVLLAQLSRKVALMEQASRLIHPLTRILGSQTAELWPVAADALCGIARQMGHEFAVFIPMIHKVMMRNHIHHPRYMLYVSRLLNREPLPEDLGFDQDQGVTESTTNEVQTEVAFKKLNFSQQQLKKAWEVSQRSTKDDWNEWIRRFSVELLKESPSHALRACASLAGSYPLLARELFNPAFVSCWGELYDQFQDELLKSLETAITSPYIPPETLQTLLNLAEFMEHDERPLPIEIRTLGLYAAKCHAFAKALHYKELEFISEPLANTIEQLISINNLLQQPDSAVGILTYAQQNHNVELKESWYERLNRWEDGLAAYERKQADDPDSVDALLGRMRCLHSLGEWESLAALAKQAWPRAGNDTRKAMATQAAAAAWGLGQWEAMDEYISVLKPDSVDSAFFHAILEIHRNNFPQALSLIGKTRDLLDSELTAIIGESYNRAYNTLVRIQKLAELEEVIQYKQLKDQPQRQAFIRNTWLARIKGCQRNVETWHGILTVRSLVVTPLEDCKAWIKFANLCRKSGRLGLSYKSLSALLTESDKDFTKLSLETNPPGVIYACLKYLWASGKHESAYSQMKTFTSTLVDKVGPGILGEDNQQNLKLLSESKDPNTTQLLSQLARCYLKLGDWRIALNEELSEARCLFTIIPEVLRSYRASTQCDRDLYKAWHAWAFANFEVLAYHEKKLREDIPKDILVAHVVPSVQGFFRSIALSKGNSLQDTLRLLTLWFKYGYQQDVNIAISEGLGTVTIDTWLDVIPQLIARIHASSSHVRRLIHQLLADIGREHPQAIVYSLTVASKSPSDARQKSALGILNKMRLHNTMLVDQALLVSLELIRVAILWYEMWHTGLEEASRVYFSVQDVDAMLETLEPLHLMLERGPETVREVAFIQGFGRDLAEAYDWCKRYKQTLNIDDINQAWALYYNVFRRISKLLPQLVTIELQYASPRLLEARDFELAIPGSYRSGDPIVRIASFLPTLGVMSSKRRPRRLNIKGSDGKDYQFLLKGDEDLRQDERVMQLFGLCNTLLAVDPETFKRHLHIHRYAVIPLSPNSGLIGWVPHCDTLHVLIKDYRESRKLLLNIEQRLMLQMAPDYDNLTLLQKREVFGYALENTTGQDLYMVLWLKSKNSEIWLERRTNYTRSLAVMSMVGYILGLGDRHPSNLMLDRFTGKVIHIDFGDCFEVAMHREKFPEKIPFRLTRMLINAMEVSGIEGNYRITCENVLRVLRDNKDSLMAVLEAFVYDPLINWRLLPRPSPKQGEIIMTHTIMVTVHSIKSTDT
eukprot:jgi/Hompol1/6525/HPOL_002279-RA